MNRTSRLSSFTAALLVLAAAPVVAQSLSPGAGALPSVVLGETYLQTIVISGQNCAPFTWTVTGTVPPGLSVSTSMGLPEATISGRPSTAGTYSFTLKVTMDPGCGFSDPPPATYSIQVLPFLVLPPTLPGGVVGTAYTDFVFTNADSCFTYSLGSGALPPGLSLVVDSITGTPTSAGAYTFTINANEGACEASFFPARSASRAYTLNIFGITTSSLPNGYYGVPYTAPNLASFGAIGGATYAVVSGAPPGLTLSAAGVFGGTPTALGTFTTTYRVTDAQNRTATRVLPLLVKDAADFTAALPDAVINQAYSGTLTSTGFLSTPTWSLTSGSLPPGLELNTATGKIAGIPTAIGAFAFSIKATAGVQSAGPKSLQITVGYPPVDFTPDTLPSGVVNSAYSQAFSPAGGDGTYVFTLRSGALPAGITLTAGGVVAGTPAQPGLFKFVVRLTSANLLIERLITLFVDSMPLELTPASLADAYLTENYGQKLLAVGGTPPYSFNVTGGALPPGLALDPAGAIAGVPGTAGSYAFTIQVSDSGKKQLSRAYTINVRTLVGVTTKSLPDGTQGESYSAQLDAQGGLAPYLYEVAEGALPPGLTLARTGQITGTPTRPGYFSFIVRAIDNNQRTAVASLAIRVFSTLSLAPDTLPAGLPFRDYNAVLTASGGLIPYTWQIIGALPDGVLFNSGVFRGAPTTSGTFTFGVQVTDARKRTVTRSYTVVIGSGPTIGIQGAPPTGQVGVPYVAQFAAQGGRAPFRWSYTGTIPPGTGVSPSSGLISGTPNAPGRFDFTLRVEDAQGLVASTPFSINITVGGIPQVSFTNLGSSSPPGGQLSFGLAIARPYQLDIQGVVTLAFKPDSGFDDPAVQFASGGRSMTFNFAAGSTAAGFGVPQVALQTGTVAGLITLTVSLNVDGADVTPSPAPVQTIRIDGAAPVITRLDLNKTSAGFELVVYGFATSRQVAQALVKLAPAAGVILPATDFPIAVSQVFTAWYGDPASAPFGSQFRLVLPFAVSDPAAIASATVTLSNAQGSSGPATANF
ncbi:MAG: putative Ig domain-containing protein [Candidatus Solibacter usitatus]|nr:putative Ig domain-containing protein [Candidatus Solibacter usitatus]